MEHLVTPYYDTRITQKEKDKYNPHGLNRTEVDSVIGKMCSEEIGIIKRGWLYSKASRCYHKARLFIFGVVHHTKKRFSRLEHTVLNSTTP
jgi:hypothetical protein